MKTNLLSISLFSFSLLSIILLSTFFTSCSKEEDEPNTQLVYTIGPNPTTGPLTITFPELKSSVSIQQNDAAGALVNSWSFVDITRAEIDLLGAAGVYFVTINADGLLDTERIIKQ